MKLGIYAVYDGAVKSFNAPLFFRSEAEACRSFAVACRDESTLFSKHPADFSFHRLGEYDDALGQCTNETAPVLVMTALQGDVPF